MANPSQALVLRFGADTSQVTRALADMSTTGAARLRALAEASAGAGARLAAVGAAAAALGSTRQQLESWFEAGRSGLDNLLSGTGLATGALTGLAGAGSLAIGSLALAFQGFSIKEFLTGVVHANKELATLADNSRYLGASTDQMQKWIYAFKTLGGLGGEAFQKGAVDLFSRMNKEFHEGDGPITKLFKANDLALDDGKGNLREFNSLLEDASRIIKNAKTEIDKLDFARQLGLSRDWVAVLEKGPAALARAGEAARAAGAIIDKELVQKAVEFDQWWDRSWNSMTTRAKAASVEIAAALKGVFESISGSSLDGAFDELRGSPAGVARRSAALKSRLGQTSDDPQILEMERNVIAAQDAWAAKKAADSARDSGWHPPSAADQIGPAVGPFGSLQRVNGQGPSPSAEDAGALTVKGRGPSDPKDNLPHGGASKHVEKEKPETGPDEVERYTEALRRNVDVLEAEKDAFGKSNEEKEKGIALARAEAAARVRGKPLTEGETQAILEQAIALGQLKDQMEAQRLAADRARATTQFFGDALVSAIDRMTAPGAKAKDVLQGIVQMLQRAALQALILGQGPLASLFGTASATAGGTGGLFGWLGGAFGGGTNALGGTGPVDLIPKFADGGIVPGATGSPQLALVHGGEAIFNPAQIAALSRGPGPSGPRVQVHNYAGVQVDTRVTHGEVRLMITQAVRASERGSLARVTEQRARQPV